ncbi:hypothetical protein BASA60_003572 [Batrachochytrium salamandrivorans]|nr:hypothetical protein BASA60_003572 [Batrachochytrium salamandrivorans]KAH9268494.1 hypothetical protein BASA83_009337 [Batrachochytrium salamandrivorans]
MRFFTIVISAITVIASVHGATIPVMDNSASSEAALEARSYNDQDSDSNLEKRSPGYGRSNFNNQMGGWGGNNWGQQMWVQQPRWNNQLWNRY